MAWLEPKTDWIVRPYADDGEYTGDFFTLTDYNRVRGNIEYLGNVILATVISLPSQSAETEGPTEVIFNNIEQNIDRIADALDPPPAIPDVKTWAGNAAAPTAGDWNRWESSLQALFVAHQRTIQIRMPARMGIGVDF